MVSSWDVGYLRDREQADFAKTKTLFSHHHKLSKCIIWSIIHISVITFTINIYHNLGAWYRKVNWCNDCFDEKYLLCI